MRIYNTLTRKKEEFKPLTDGEVKMYACGITVSGEAHIGHAIQAIIFDIVRKYLSKCGYKVTYARNYTDVDDKIIANAQKLGVDPMDFARRNITTIDNSMKKLGVDHANLELKATENISNIIEFVSKLIEKGYAYATKEGDVYFSVEKYSKYGELSNRNIEEQLSGVRIDSEDNKKFPLDFALWKSAKPGEIFWVSPWGNGRPGWHIECSAMNYYHLGEQIDIHGGGRDLIFPHHENEIAQTQSLTGKQFAKYWMHNGLVKINGQKMSKSLGNSIFLNDLLNKYDNEIIRFALLQTNYKNDINITDNLFSDAKLHMLDFYRTLNLIEMLNIKSTAKNPQIDKDFNMAMNDDFNTALTLANLFTYFKTMKKKLANNDNSVIEEYNAVKETYSLLGLFKHNSQEFIAMNEEHSEMPVEIEKMAQSRLEAKKSKDFSTADAIRAQIDSLGYIVTDVPNGYKLTKK